MFAAMSVLSSTTNIFMFFLFRGFSFCATKKNPKEFGNALGGFRCPDNSQIHLENSDVKNIILTFMLSYR